MRSLQTILLWVLCAWGSCGVIFCAIVARAQGITGFSQPQKSRGHVSYAPEPTQVTAGKPTFVEMRFRVDDGFHVNSHKPSSELLIATALKLEPTAGVKIVREEYPKGTAFRLKVGEGETLDVYQGEFRVRVEVVAPRGDSVIYGSLHYQACDAAACFPPKTLPVSLMIVGK